MRWIIASLLLVAVTGQFTHKTNNKNSTEDRKINIEKLKDRVKLTLYNNDLATDHPDGVVIWPTNPEKVDLTNLKNKELKVFIHGYWSKGKKYHEEYQITTKFLKNGDTIRDINVIIVSWHSYLPYGKAARRAMKVGDFMAAWLRKIMCERKQDTGKGDLIHLIGHSLGAHAVGKAGRMMTKEDCSPKRVTGLDPAGPYFEWFTSLTTWIWKTETQLIGRNSGQFVDIIHTNPGIFGVRKPYGHLDFYVDGGMQNLACFRDNKHICSIHKNKNSHSYATKLFVNTINKPQRYMSTRCQTVQPRAPHCPMLPYCLRGETTNYAGMGAVPELLPQSYRTDLPNSECTEVEDEEERRDGDDDGGDDWEEGEDDGSVDWEDGEDDGDDDGAEEDGYF